MKLVHYSAEPLGELRVVEQAGDTFKPRGLWVSDDDCEDNWRAWCEGENFRLEALTHRTEIELKPGANVLVLETAFQIDEFTDKWHVAPPFPASGFHSRMFIDWTGLRAHYAGMIVTPYIWSRRLSMGDTPDAMWYYSWDCASGCIWNPDAIQNTRLLHT